MSNTLGLYSRQTKALVSTLLLASAQVGCEGVKKSDSTADTNGAGPVCECPGPEVENFRYHGTGLLVDFPEGEVLEAQIRPIGVTTQSDGPRSESRLIQWTGGTRFALFPDNENIEGFELLGPNADVVATTGQESLRELAKTGLEIVGSYRGVNPPCLRLLDSVDSSLIEESSTPVEPEQIVSRDDMADVGFSASLVCSCAFLHLCRISVNRLRVWKFEEIPAVLVPEAPLPPPPIFD